MLRFFSKIRYQLAAENRVLKYLRYAVGEIVLVVIGILIALQVNNWNQDRKSRNEGELIEHNIHEEFLQNQGMLLERIQLLENAFESGYTLLNLVGCETSEIAMHNIDSLFYFMFNTEDYLPSRNTVDDMLQSGRLNLINQELSKQLLQWTRKMEQIISWREGQILWQNEHIVTYLLPYISFTQMDQYGNVKWGGKSKIIIDYSPLFQRIETANILENNLFYIQNLINQLHEIEIIQTNIIELTTIK